MQATSMAAPIPTNVPMGLFDIGFLVILVIFLVWYIVMRRRS
ncbi:MAG: hypothetical protein JWN01_905 [Patescibacteria group bacterium]|nr:hypothetical protein [Patescibacteria group bacterium]